MLCAIGISPGIGLPWIDFTFEKRGQKIIAIHGF